MRNAGGSAEHRINEVRSGKFALIDPEQHSDATAEALAADFPEGTWFEVLGYGVGDGVRGPMAVSVTQKCRGSEVRHHPSEFTSSTHA